MDWDLFWEDPWDIDEMEEGAHRMALRLMAFMDAHSKTTVADFGCGPALTLFHLAKEMPYVSFVGFDTSLGIVEANRRRTEEQGLRNLKFEQDSLPDLSTTDSFELVVCIATLHYVKEIRAAILALFERVAYGGHLIFNYPNRYTQYAFKRWAMDGDPKRSDRFKLVIQGANLMTKNDVANLLGERPNSFWKIVGEESSRENVCLVVKK